MGILDDFLAGQVQLEDKAPEAQLKTANDKVAAAESSKNKEAEGLAQLLLSSVSTDAKDAMKAAKSGLDTLKSAKSKEGEAVALVAIANAQNQDPQANREDALDKSRQALDLFKGQKNKKGEAVALSAIMKSHLCDKQDAAEALAASKDAIALLQEQGMAKQEADALHAMGQIYMALDRPDLALVHLKAAQTSMSKLGSKAGELNVLHTLVSAGLAVPWGGNDAVRAAEDAMELVKALRRDEGEEILRLAQAHLHKGEPYTALQKALDAQEKFEAAGNTSGKASSIQCLAAVRSFLKRDSEEALTSGKQALELFEGEGDRKGQASALKTLAQVYFARGDGEHGMRNAKDSLKMFQDMGDRRGAQGVNSLMSNAGNLSGPKSLEAGPLGSKDIGGKKVAKDLKFERQQFGWRDATADYTYTIVWQPQTAEFRPGGRGLIANCTTGHGGRSTLVPQAFGLKSFGNKEQHPKGWAVAMISADACQYTSSSIMFQLHTISSMIVARCTNLCFCLIGEKTPNHPDTIMCAQQVHLCYSFVGVIRSARLEAPNVTCGFVCGDTASWIMDRTPLIQAMSDSCETSESEMVYNHGEAFTPILVHRPLTPAAFVFPDKK